MSFDIRNSELIVPGLHHPAGLALGKDDQTLYVAEMYSASIIEIDLAVGKPSLKRIVELNGGFSLGSLTSLAFNSRDIECRFLYAAENLREMIAVIDLESKPARSSFVRVSSAWKGASPVRWICAFSGV